METHGPFTYEVDEDLVVEAMRRHMKRRLTTGLIGWLLLAVLVLLAILLVLELVFFRRLSNSLITLAIAVPIVIYGINMWLVPNMGRRQFRQSANLRSQTSIAWDDKAIIFESERGNARLPIEELYRWDETDRTILIYQTEMFFNLVPRAALGDAAPDLVARMQAAGVKRN